MAINRIRFFQAQLEKAKAELKAELITSAACENHGRIAQILREFPELYGDKDCMFNLFLHHVAFGQQDQAKALLQASRWHQDLVQMEGPVTDLSGRQFSNITALQYAAWAKDRHMAEMLTDNMPAKLALIQLTQLKSRGTKYGRSYNPQSLVNAYEDYIAHGQQMDWRNCIADARKTLKALWLNVGMEQVRAPAHFMHELLREDEPVLTHDGGLRNFKDDTLPRTTRIFNDFHIYHVDHGYDYRLGVHFAIARGNNKYCADVGDVEFADIGRVASTYVAGADFAALNKLNTQRTLEFQYMEDHLAERAAHAMRAKL